MSEPDTIPVTSIIAAIADFNLISPCARPSELAVTESVIACTIPWVATSLSSASIRAKVVSLSCSCNEPFIVDNFFSAPDNATDFLVEAASSIIALFCFNRF